MTLKITFRLKAFYYLFCISLFVCFTCPNLLAQSVTSCPTITKTLTKRINLPCVGGGAIGELNLSASGGTAPYTFTMNGTSNTTGVFTGLKPKDYLLIITDNDGCRDTSIETIESPTNFTSLNNALSAQTWTADSLNQTLTYLVDSHAVLTPSGDSLSAYNTPTSDSISRFIPMGFSFLMDNFYYDSLVVSENGVVAFNRKIDPLAVASQWSENGFYTGKGNGNYTPKGGIYSDTAYLKNGLPFIAAFRDDLQANDKGDLPSKITYLTTGTAPNRKFTVEWRQMRWHKACNSERNNAITVQLILYEGTNKIEMNYKAEPNLGVSCDPPPADYGYTVGLFGRRLGNGNYLVYKPESNSAHFSNIVVENDSIPTQTSYFPDGKLLRFTPPVLLASCSPLSISTVSVLGSHGADGSISLTVIGGLPKSGNYFFSKDDGTNYDLGTTNDGTYTFTGLAPGTYTIVVHDNQFYPIPNNPTPSQWSFVTQTIIVPDALVFETEKTDVACNGSASGTIKVTASGGFAPYVFSKDNGTNYTSFPNPHTFTGLTANTYKIRVKDASGVETVASDVIIGEAMAISFTSSKTDETCTLANGTITIASSGGTGNQTITCDICPNATVAGVYSGLSANTYIFTATDASNCTKTTSVTISNIPATIPPPNAIANQTVCKNTIVTITPTGGTDYKFYSSNPTLGSITPLSTSTPYAFSATANTTIWVTKIVGSCESAPISTTVSTDDITPPTALCKAVTIQLNEVGTVALTAAQVDNGSTDNCDFKDVSINKTSFDCTNLGTNTVILTATDVAGNTATCSASITVEDKTAPSVSCKPVTIELDATGNATLAALQVDNSLSTDNCGITSRTVSKTSFDCTNIGINTVLFTAEDASGNSANCTTTISVEDFIPPSVSCKPVTIQLDATGNAVLTAEQVDNNTTDNCSITNRSVSKTSFNCLNVGTNTVIFTATDIAGNTATCSVSITVEDKMAPSVLCKPVTIQLDAIGNATLTAAQVDNGSTDNCGINSKILSKTSFNCSNIGTNTIIFTATDGSGNSATCSTTITVEDKIAPTIRCPANMTVQLGSGECRKVVSFAATATDNCTISPTVVQTGGLRSGDLFGIGTFNVGFKATDASFNTSFCSFSITVNENPADGSMVCLSQINVTIAENCRTRLLPESMLIGSHYSCFENYNIKIFTLSGTVLPDDYVSSNQIGATLRAVVSNQSLNTSCSTLFKVYDSTPPTIQAPPAVVITCDQIGTNGIPLSSVSGEPTIVKECSLPTTMYYNDNIIDVNCATNLTSPPADFPADMPFDAVLAQGAKRIVIRTFYVSDRYNNRSSARQAIYIRTNLLYEVLLTENRTFTCGNVRTEPKDTVINGVTIAGTGYPSLPNSKSLSETFCPIGVGYADVRQNTATGYIIHRSWVITNTCTNTSRNWAQLISVQDAPPTMTLKQNLVFQIPNTRRVDVLANDLIASLTDNCTPRANMVLGIRKAGTGTGFPTNTSLSFACGDQGIYTVEVWARDQGGNILTQNTSLSIKDDAGNCVLPSIAGLIQRENNTDVPAKTMLYNANDIPVDSITGSSYYFSGMLPNNRFRVMPTRPNTDWINGVTMFDVALLSRHVLGVEALSTPYRLIAADVNNSGDVDAVDMLLTQRLILRTIPALPNNNSWRFVLKNYVFSDPTEPFSSDFPEILLIPNLTTTIANGNFVAIKVGDVNLSAGSVIIRGGLQPFLLSVEDKVLEKNKTYQIPINITPFQKDFNGQNLTALQFALNIDKNKTFIDNIEHGNLPNCTENNIGFFKNEGIVNAAWYRTPQQKFVENDTFTVFNLTIKPTINTRLSDILSINPTYTEGVAYDEKGNGATVKLSFGNNFKETTKAVLLPNRPNPFHEETTISFVLPESSAAKLTVCDLMGKVLMQTEKEFSAGLNEVIFNAQTAPSVSSGILVVRLQTGKTVLEQKVVFSH